MTKQLLEEALAFFPSQGEQWHPRFVGWRTCVELLRQHLISLEQSDRAALFATACDTLKEMGFHESWTARYWFFSHPTFGMFEDFLNDIDVCRAFADFLEFVSIGRGKGNRRLRRRLKKLMEVKENETRLLAARYAALLRAHGEELFGFFQDPKRRSLKRMVIIPYPDTDTAIRACCEREERAILEEELAKLMKGVAAYATQVVRIFQTSEQALLSPHMPSLRSLSDEMFEYLEMVGFTPVVPGDWKNINHVEKAIARLIRNGRWPKFTALERRTADVQGPRHVQFSVRPEALQHIKKAYLTETGALCDRLRSIKNGLLPVGLKIHCADHKAPGMEFLNTGGFSAHNAGTCFNLPPVGNITAVSEMLALIEQRSGVSYLDNPDFQIQVCSPGELSVRNAAFLGIGFYLGSDRIRRYKPGDFVTTHNTGDRLIIYGAHVVDQSFEWWNKNSWGGVQVGPMPDKLTNRTDVLTCQSMRDIENVNLIATLLVHAQFGGYWSELGEQFIADMEELLAKHQLSGLLEAGWVRPGYHGGIHYTTQGAEDDQRFVDALEELMNYAYQEVDRISRAQARGDDTDANRGILFETQALLGWYRAEVIAQAYTEGGAA